MALGASSMLKDDLSSYFLLGHQFIIWQEGRAVAVLEDSVIRLHMVA